MTSVTDGSTRIKTLFIPCTVDGLPRNSGSARIRSQWVARYWDGAEIYNASRGLDGYDLYIFQKVYLSAWARKMIRSLAAFRDESHKCLLALDMCDADWLDPEHERRLMKLLPLFDFAVSPTQPLTDWLARHLPAYVVPDRVDLEDVASIRDRPRKSRGGVGPFPDIQQVRSAGSSPRLVWAGYTRNGDMLEPLREVINRLDLPMTIIGIEREPKPFHDFWRQVAEYDILLNPRPDTEAYRGKSDNKTVISWSIGLPVARTEAELIQLLDARERQDEIAKRFQEVRDLWDVRLSVDQWREIYEHEAREMHALPLREWDIGVTWDRPARLSMGVAPDSPLCEDSMPTMTVRITWDSQDELRPENVAWALNNCTGTKFTVAEIAPDFARADEALRVIDSYNHIRNDLDAYLDEVARWGRGMRTERPNPKEYGLGDDPRSA